MRSSYKNCDLNYGDLITAITSVKNPKKIVEIGILDGFSLEKFVNASSSETIIIAYDLFDDFNGNHAHKDFILDKFKNNKNVSIKHGDFYKLNEIIDENIDIIHIDIANNGDVLDYVMQNYMPKLAKDGIIIFEGGSSERDNVEWMIKYNKPRINNSIQKYVEKEYDIRTYGAFPSLTIIKNKLIKN